MLTRPVTVLLNEGGGSFAVASLYGCPLGFFCTSAHSPDVAIDGGGNSIVVFTASAPRRSGHGSRSCVKRLVTNG